VLPDHIQTATQAKEYLRGILGRACQQTGDLSDEYKKQNGARIGSTVVTAAITPDGRIVRANMGDSLLIAYVIDKNNRVVGTHLLSTLHNEDPYATNVIHHTAQQRSYEELLGVRTNQFESTHDVSSLARKGQKIILVAASDGITDTAPNAPRTMAERAALHYVAKETQKTLEAYAPLISKALQKGRTAEDVARAIIEGAAKFKKNELHDNTSAVVAIIDPENLPRRGIVLAVADGCGPEGILASQTVRQVFEGSLDPISKLDCPYEEICGYSWSLSTNDRNMPLFFSPLSSLTRRAREDLENTLRNAGIDYDIEKNSRYASVPVLLVQGYNAVKLARIFDKNSPYLSSSISHKPGQYEIDVANRMNTAKSADNHMDGFIYDFYYSAIKEATWINTKSKSGSP